MTEIAWTNLNHDFAQKPGAVTIGVFDGVHLGHQELIHRVVGSRWTSVVVTFQRHPSEALLHDSIPGFIMSSRQKRHTLERLGVDVAVLIDFTESFRRIPGREFLAKLAESFSLRRLVVGHDFRCGYRLDTDIDGIRSFFAGSDVDVVAVDPVADGAPVSSTRIRELIVSGDVARAGALLGRPYSLDVANEEVEHDGARSYIVKGERNLLLESRQLLPPPGPYRAEIGTGVSDGELERIGSEVTLEIGENSLSWPLAPGATIRYIIIKERR